MKHFKEDKKDDINIMKEEDGILINIHGTKYHQTTLQQDIIRDQKTLQIGEAKTKIHGIKGNKDFNFLVGLSDGKIYISTFLGS
jgi:hypothetical protein